MFMGVEKALKVEHAIFFPLFVFRMEEIEKDSNAATEIDRP